MRSDRMLGHKYVEDSSSSQMTGRAGLLPYLDLACVLGLLREADARIGVCGDQGWMDRRHVVSLALLNLAGGDCVEDIRILESDVWLCRIFGEAERYGLGQGSRKTVEKRFRKGRSRTFPSPTRLYEYLDEFHNEAEEAKRVQGKAFIPARNEHLEGLCEVNTALIASVVRHAPQKEATLDIDATLGETTKREVLFCYEG